MQSCVQLLDKHTSAGVCSTKWLSIISRTCYEPWSGRSVQHSILVNTGVVLESCICLPYLPCSNCLAPLHSPLIWPVVQRDLEQAAARQPEGLQARNNTAHGSTSATPFSHYDDHPRPTANARASSAQAAKVRREG
jgi:hypothetical protein